MRNLPVGLGVPVFDRLEADLAKAMLSLPATKGFEVGSGFDGSLLKGSEHNDVFINKDGKVGTATNRSGGVQGGISNGEELIFRVAFKPTATLIQKQDTVDKDGKETELMGRGRHDPSCHAPCRSSNPWLHWCSSTTGCVTRPSAIPSISAEIEGFRRSNIEHSILNPEVSDTYSFDIEPSMF